MQMQTTVGINRSCRATPTSRPATHPARLPARPTLLLELMTAEGLRLLLGSWFCVFYVESSGNSIDLLWLCIWLGLPTAVRYGRCVEVASGTKGVDFYNNGPMNLAGTGYVRLQRKSHSFLAKNHLSEKSFCKYYRTTQAAPLWHIS